MADRENIWEGAAGTSTAASTPDYSAAQVVDVNLEIGPQLEAYTTTKVVPVDQEYPPAQFVVKAHVITRGAKGLRSPQYLATTRRREAGKIAGLIKGLAAHAQSEDFVVWTHEPLEKLRALIHKLTEAEEFADPEHEGNSCEVLRQLRDTLLNTGWERYREPAVRGAAVAILQRLAVADEVSADDAYWAMDQLLELGLNPAAGTLFGYGEEEETEVPD